jgi:hypothetical protein
VKMTDTGEERVLDWAEETARGKRSNVEETWRKYKAVTIGVLEDSIGKKEQSEKCQGKWYEVGWDGEIARLCKRRREVWEEVKQARKEGRREEEKEGKAVVSKIRRKMKHRIREIRGKKAREVVTKMEESMTSKNVKEGWRRLKQCAGMNRGGKKDEMKVMIDEKGIEKRGEQVLEIVKEAWRRLGLTDLKDSKFDRVFAEQVKEEVRRLERESDRIENRSDRLDRVITLKEVSEVCKRVKKGKASGFDEIITEWLKYGGERMTFALWMMMNEVWMKEKWPEDWGRGMIRPLFKEGDKRDPLNYRGITLLSVVGKLFSSILNKRLSEYLEEEGGVVDEQGGFREGRGCPEQIFALTEVLKMRRNRPTFCCFIDIKKAYDRVWRDGLWKRLWEVGVRGRMWRVIKEGYSRVESCGLVGDRMTDWFNIEVGVRQGCTLSPTLFSVFIDGLARAIKNLGLGVEVGEERLTLLLYADDIVLLAETEQDLQKMVSCIYEYSRKWRFELNSKKTQVVVFGKRKKEACIKLGEVTLEEVDSYKYLGMVMQKRGSWKIQKERVIRKARARMFGAWNLLVRSGRMGVGAGEKVWKALIRPVLEYGAEVWETEHDRLWEEAELMQREMGRRILGCSRRMVNEVVLGELGWMTMRGRRKKLRLGFWAKILSMKEERWVKKVYEESRRRYEEEGEKNWCSMTHEILKEIGLEEAWEEQEVGADWKDQVGEAVLKKEEEAWQAGMKKKIKTEHYRKWKKRLVFEKYLLEDSNREGRRQLTRLRGGVHCLRIETGRWETVRVRRNSSSSSSNSSCSSSSSSQVYFNEN